MWGTTTHPPPAGGGWGVSLCETCTKMLTSKCRRANLNPNRMKITSLLLLMGALVAHGQSTINVEFDVPGVFGYDVDWNGGGYSGLAFGGESDGDTIPISPPEGWSGQVVFSFTSDDNAWEFEVEHWPAAPQGVNWLFSGIVAQSGSGSYEYFADAPSFVSFATEHYQPEAVPEPAVSSFFLLTGLLVKWRTWLPWFKDLRCRSTSPSSRSSACSPFTSLWRAFWAALLPTASATSTVPITAGADGARI